MARELLGTSFDIHGGGLDLQFPHHENESAQSRCANPDASFARYWLHNEMLQVEGKKMSKSLGNFFTVRDLLDQGIPGEVIRLVLLGTHYGKPMDWTDRKRFEAEATLRRWRELTEGAEDRGFVAEEVVEPLADDLNTPLALARLHELARTIANGGGKDCFFEKGQFLSSARLLGLLEEGKGGWTRGATDPELIGRLTRALLRAREAAVANKDFAIVDHLKRELTAAGVEVRMSKADITLHPGPGADAARLAALDAEVAR
jgi:cysteinyl-tRNA synthetase